jgi:hypothetical protein
MEVANSAPTPPHPTPPHPTPPHPTPPHPTPPHPHPHPHPTPPHPTPPHPTPPPLPINYQDKSGFIEAAEVMEVANFVCKKVGLSGAPAPAVNMVFDKVAGTDGRVDRAEFAEMLK